MANAACPSCAADPVPGWRCGRWQRCPSLRSESLRAEQETGADSIPTIERVYERTPAGGIMCCWPGCSFVRHDPERMWRHVHGHAHADARPVGAP